jgi:HPt (histidine-containing phosphotransfer) domain-containing protein
MDIEALSENIGIDVDTYLMLLNLFYKSTVESMGVIETAVHENQSEAAARGAHSIKGAAANLGIDDISELAKEIEGKARNNKLPEIPLLVKPLREKLGLVKVMLP